MIKLKEVFDAIDQIDNLDELNELDKKTRDSSYTNIFWEQRQLAVLGKTKLIRKKAFLKCRAIAKFYNASIPAVRNIRRFNTPHGFAGIHISAYAKIGQGCTIFQHVVIGSNTLPDSRSQGSPVIGNNVYIGAGAMIIGNVHVGDNVRIGANAIVTKDVPPNSVVVSSKQRTIRKDVPLNNKFIPVGVYMKNKAAEVGSGENRANHIQPKKNILHLFKKRESRWK